MIRHQLKPATGTYTNHLLTRITTTLALTLLTLTILSYLTLSFSSVSADTVDNVSITVPVSCTLTSTVDTAHTKDIYAGTYEENIGITTLKSICNDNNGFAIYAAGYTNDEIGGENSNKLVGTTTNISTGLATSGATSTWAMKLTKTSDSGDTTGSNAFTIDSAPNEGETTSSSFSDYHTVPNEYVKVAHKTAATSMDTTTGGATLQTTYRAYISPTQPAGTYNGKVIYTLVHPSDASAPVHPDQIGVNYNANGSSFTGGNTTNNVVYAMSPMYIATTPTISKSPNVIDEDIQNGGNAADTDVCEKTTIAGATKLKVEIKYDLTTDGNTYISYVDQAVDNWDDATNWQELPGGTSGTETIYLDGGSVTFRTYTERLASEDYGYFAEVYPIYATEQPNTEASSDLVGLAPVSGTYATTTTWNGRWYVMTNDEITWLTDESAVINYLTDDSSTLLGTTIDIYAYNPYTINYNGNNATAGTMTGFYTTLETTSSTSTANLMAPNFKRTGYGFAGWSENQNATVNSNDTIYGPNEKITGSDLTFDTTHEATLYAVWVQSTGDMQTFSCSSLNPGQITALTDTRDNNVYTVGKMQDGNCWMMENLRLDNTATITSANTNNPATGFTSLSATSDTWCTATNSACYDQSMLNTNNTNIGGTNATGTTLTVTPEGNTNHNQWYGYGNYYNWYSATAGNGTYSTGSVVTGDICPTGWHLPNGGTSTGTNGGAVSGGFSYLDTQLGGTGDFQRDNEGEEIVSNRWRSFPNNFLYSGGWSSSSAGDRGSLGDYWSRTARGTNSAYRLSFSSGYVYPGTRLYGGKNSGSSVRCLAQ